MRVSDARDIGHVRVYFIVVVVVSPAVARFLLGRRDNRPGSERVKRTHMNRAPAAAHECLEISHIYRRTSSYVFYVLALAYDVCAIVCAGAALVCD